MKQRILITINPAEKVTLDEYCRANRYSRSEFVAIAVAEKIDREGGTGYRRAVSAGASAVSKKLGPTPKGVEYGMSEPPVAAAVKKNIALCEHGAMKGLCKHGC